MNELYTRGMLSGRVRSRMAEIGMTQAGLAEVSGITPAAVNRIVRGSRTPHAATLVALADALDVSADWLLGTERTCRNAGRPYRDGEDFVCSECGCMWSLIAGTPAENGMSYCPECGARIEDE